MSRSLPLVFALVVSTLGTVDVRAEGISPEVQPGGRVTFRVRAPKAERVLVKGNWLKPGEDLVMSKGDDGIWSATSDPLPPGNHIYDFDIDGERVPDPWNPMIKPRVERSGSYVHVPGDAPWQPRDVPHGNVEINFHQSKLLGDLRWFTVYTPPGYHETPDARYPVLYMLHGRNDTPIGWTLIGMGNHILDNLIADPKDPLPGFIVVSPNGHAAPFGSPWQENAPKVESYVIDEVIPLVESKYRVRPGARNRAIAGFSMGGGHAVRIGLKHLDMFGAIASFSGALPNSDEEVDTIRAALENPKRVNTTPSLFWLGCGRDDFLLDRNRKFHAILDRERVKHEFHETDGVHNSDTWRRHFTEVAPRLFAGADVQ